MSARLRELCAAMAALRQRLATTRAQADAALPARLAGLLAELGRVTREGGDRALIVALLDEASGLVGQLELERAAARAALQALDRHRRARRCYAGAARSR